MMKYYSVNLEQPLTKGAKLSVDDRMVWAGSPLAAVKKMAEQHGFDLRKLSHMSVDER